MSNWRNLETEILDITRRTLANHSDIGDLDNGDKGIVKWCLGDAYEVLNLSELARELDARGIK